MHRLSDQPRPSVFSQISDLAIPVTDFEHIDAAVVANELRDEALRVVRISRQKVVFLVLFTPPRILLYARSIGAHIAQQQLVKR
jgi:hypothetical protein